jgi:hypothetical protein
MIQWEEQEVLLKILIQLKSLKCFSEEKVVVHHLKLLLEVEDFQEEQEYLLWVLEWEAWDKEWVVWDKEWVVWDKEWEAWVSLSLLDLISNNKVKEEDSQDLVSLICNLHNKEEDDIMVYNSLFGYYFII